MSQFLWWVTGRSWFFPLVMLWVFLGWIGYVDWLTAPEFTWVMMVVLHVYIAWYEFENYLTPTQSKRME